MPLFSRLPVTCLGILLVFCMGSETSLAQKTKPKSKPVQQLFPGQGPEEDPDDFIDWLGHPERPGLKKKSREDFGSGKITTTISTQSESVRSVVFQTDGRIVTTGFAYKDNGAGSLLPDFALVRYVPEGDLDLSFNNTGKVATAIGTHDDRIHGVVLLSDARFVVGGRSHKNILESDFAFARYHSNGELDTSFRTVGYVTTSAGTGADIVRAIAVDASGRVVAAGYSWSTSEEYDLIFQRYSTNGEVDTSFATTGFFRVAMGGSAIPTAITIDADGRSIITGGSYNSTHFDMAVFRVSTNGELDTAFQTLGKLRFAIGTTQDVGYSVVLHSGGTIVLAGNSKTGAELDFAVVRLSSNGVLDTTFNTGGVKIIDHQVNDTFHAVVAMTDGTLVGGGYSSGGAGVSTNDFAMVRFTSNGAADTSFNTTGINVTSIGTGAEGVHSIAVKNNSIIIGAGETSDGTYSHMGVVRYSNEGSVYASGSLDPSFGTSP